jgi:hypothetical protein
MAQDNDELTINMLVKSSRKIWDAIEKEAEDLEIDAPTPMKMLLIANTIHGGFVLQLTKNPLTAKYASLFENLLQEMLYEKTVLLEAIKHTQQKNRT